MEVDSTPPANASSSRETTAPFLVRAFVKIGSFHRLSLFEDGVLPTTDEQQLFTWKDATLREVLTTLRITAPNIPEYKHPLARFSFRAVYADPTLRGRFAQKDLGMVYSRDILGEPGALNTTAPRLLEDTEGAPTDREREERTLDDLKYIPGDYLLIAVLLPKNVTVSNEVSIKGSGNAWKSAPTGRADAAWGGPGSSAAPRGSEGHWRGGGPKHPPPGSRRGGRNGDTKDLDKDKDMRVPPPRRRGSTPPPPPRGGRGRGGRSDRRSRSRSRTPPRRRYD
ncbi:hypothetical protein Agabi119p4_4055 [Agaricus bisporus var. burnettii]|uniref:Histone deacetylase complex subunit SAP18 n=1 Tax=Agaricus bisporus var. burnettii TaxID=192524 RepID=A0A8H7F2L8_AGABI|nr:hypothetical protein Agabi119p4_4055 [Agaricus bisporus var. burnettii]